MLLKKLVEKYSHLIEIKTSSSEEVFISGISSCEFPEPKKIIFIKSSKYVEELTKNLKGFQASDLVVLFHKSVLAEGEDLDNAMQNFQPTTMCALGAMRSDSKNNSKIFSCFFKKLPKSNDFVRIFFRNIFRKKF